jgi:hypothetical protein
MAPILSRGARPRFAPPGDVAYGNATHTGPPADPPWAGTGSQGNNQPGTGTATQGSRDYRTPWSGGPRGSATRPLGQAHGQEATGGNSVTGPGTYNRAGQHRDRHVYWSTGNAYDGDPGPYMGAGVPAATAPQRPGLAALHRGVDWQIGDDATRFADNLGPFLQTQGSGGRMFFLGVQDGSGAYTKINGGTPHLYRPYGSRGGAGTVGPAAATFGTDAGTDPATGQPVYSGTVLSTPADMGDGPQKIPPSLPHGLHSPTVRDGAQTWARRRVIPFPQGVRANRPANSRIAGQSYSQTVQRQASAAPSPLPKMTAQQAGRSPGLVSRRRAT